MIKIILILLALLFSGCLNKHGISAKYYSDCKEYYDLQGYYHKECGEDDIVTYKKAGETIVKTGGEIIDKFTKNKRKPKPAPNVW